MRPQHQLLGWKVEDWTSLQNLAKEEINRTRVIATILGKEQVSVSDRNVKNEVVMRLPNGVEVNDRNFLPLVELSSYITLDRAQIDDDNKETVRLAIADAARAYSRTTDILLANGQQGPNVVRCPANVVQPQNCNIAFGCRHGGLRSPIIHLQAGNPPVVINVPNNTLAYPQELIEGIMRARGVLRGNDHEAPYDLILSAQQMQAAHYPTPNLQLPIFTIKPLLTPHGQDTNTPLSGGKVVESSSLDDREAILFSRKYVDVAWSYDGDLQVVNPTEPAQLRIFGAFALRIKDPTASVLIRYEPV